MPCPPLFLRYAPEARLSQSRPVRGEEGPWFPVVTNSRPDGPCRSSGRCVFVRVCPRLCLLDVGASEGDERVTGEEETVPARLVDARHAVALAEAGGRP